jgi:hypothetical protein
MKEQVPGIAGMKTSWIDHGTEVPMDGDDHGVLERMLEYLVDKHWPRVDERPAELLGEDGRQSPWDRRSGKKPEKVLHL